MVRACSIRPVTNPILAIDTVGPWCAAAIKVDEETHRIAEEIGRGHAERLAPMVQALLTQAGVSPADLHRIGVNVGPGSFAGARVGVSFARGLVLATRARAIGVGLLPALARRADPAGGRTVFAIHDAKRGEYLWSIFKPGNADAPIQRGMLAAAQAAAADVPQPLITGSGAAAVGGPVFDGRPPLEALLTLTAAAPDDAPPPAPLYARPPDAKPA